MPIVKDIRKRSLTGTLPVNNTLLTETVPVNKSLLTRTLPVNNFLLTGTLKGYSSPIGKLTYELSLRDRSSII